MDGWTDGRTDYLGNKTLLTLSPAGVCGHAVVGRPSPRALSGGVGQPHPVAWNKPKRQVTEQQRTD